MSAKAKAGKFLKEAAEAAEKNERWAFWGGPDHRKAAALYEDAAYNFKMNKSWAEAAETARKAAACHLKLENPNYAGHLFMDAADYYRSAKDMSGTISCLEDALREFEKVGNFVRAASVCKEIGMLSETEQKIDKAIASFNQAGDYFNLQNEVVSEKECREKVFLLEAVPKTSADTSNSSSSKATLPHLHGSVLSDKSAESSSQPPQNLTSVTTSHLSSSESPRLSLAAVTYDKKMEKGVSDRGSESLMLDMLFSYADAFYANRPKLAARKMEASGYQIGHEVAGRYPVDRPAIFSDHLEAIRYLSTHFWPVIFKKRIDSLWKDKDNRTFVLKDNMFRWVECMPVDPVPVSVTKSSQYASAGSTEDTTEQPTSLRLCLPCGVIRGALSCWGISCVVSAKKSTFPACTFKICIKE